MKKLIGVIAIILASFSFASAELIANGQQAPMFELPTLDGEGSISLAEHEGRLVYIDFWASWCAPCRRAFPKVVELHETYHEQGFDVLALSLDRKPEAGQRFFNAQKAEFAALYDAGGTVARSYGVRSIPSTVIIGPDGKVLYTAVGLSPQSEKDIIAVIEANLPPPAEKD